MILSMEKEGNARYGQIRSIMFFFLVVLVLAIFKIAQSILLPLVVAVFLFVLVNPILSHMDRLKVPNVLSIIAVMAIVLTVFLLAAYLVFQMVNMVALGLPRYAQRLAELDRLLSVYAARFFDVKNPESYSFLASLNIDWIGIATSYLASFSTKFISILSDVMMVLIYLLFLLLERKSFSPKLQQTFPSEKAQRISTMLLRVNRQVSKYVFLKLVISLISGVMFYLVALFTGLDFALVWGVLAVVLNFIPTIGSIVVTGGTIIMAIIQFLPQWGTVIFIAFLMIMVEMIMGNIIDPKLQGVQLNISPIVILISLALWGYIWGILGMFLAVPLTSIIQIICANIPSVKFIAVFLSTGKFHEVKDEKARRAKRKGGKGESFDVEMPQGSNPSDS